MDITVKTIIPIENPINLPGHNCPSLTIYNPVIIDILNYLEFERKLELELEFQKVFLILIAF